MKKLIGLLMAITVMEVADASPVFSAVTLPWSTTFNCTDWTQSTGLGTNNVNCNGLAGNGNWTCDNGDGTVREDQIRISANNSNGGGGKGLTHWKGDGYDNNSGGMMINFNSVKPELWIRWYMRYEKGFKWNPLTMDKWLYIGVGEPCAVVPQWYGQNTVNVWSGCSSNHFSPSGNGWDSIMGSSASDGQWHYYETHIKIDTNGSNGIAEMWVDGIQRILYKNIYMGGDKISGWGWILIGSNQLWPNNGRCMAVDFDDFAVSTTGYIGPVGYTGGGTNNVPPSKPLNLQAN